MGTKIMTSGGLDMTCLAAGTVAAEVRQRIALRLAAWRLEPLTHDACLIAAELVSNACEATPEREIRVWFARKADCVELGVWDSSGVMPKAQPLIDLSLENLDMSEDRFDDNGGWGLQLVESLSSAWGTTETIEPSGKWVWARVAI